MDLNKAIRLEMVGIWDAGQTKASEAWYARARRERDYFKQDYFQNCAIFRSKVIAKQETLKMHQKSFANRVFSKDSGSAIMHFDSSSLGLDVSHAKSSSEYNESAPLIISDYRKGYQWMPEYLRESLISDSFKMVSILKEVSSERGSVSLVVSWFLVKSGYVRVMKPEDIKFWSQELRIIEAISDQDPTLKKQTLWELTEYTRYQIRQSHALLIKKLAKIYPDYLPKIGVNNNGGFNTGSDIDIDEEGEESSDLDQDGT